MPSHQSIPSSARVPLIRALQAHAKLTASPAHAAACAPGRINIIGEHTDYNLGYALPMAIDRWCAACCSIAPAGSPTTVRSLTVDQSAEFDITTVKPADIAPWARYAAGALSVTAAALAPRPASSLPALHITLDSTVPLGSGLSSSASIEVAVATMAIQAWNAVLPPTQIAIVAQRAETTFAGVPCGIMDQLTSACSKAGHAMLVDFRSMHTEHIPAPNPGRAVLMIANSGVRHSLASGEYAKRRAACTEAAVALGVQSLRDVDSVRYESGRLTDHQHACVRHVVSENMRTLAAAEALKHDDLSELGRLMVASHASLRDDYKVSCAELDALVESALACSDVLGARMTGGGFGGCVIALVGRRGAENLKRTWLEACPDADPFIAHSEGGAFALGQHELSTILEAGNPDSQRR